MRDVKELRKVCVYCGSGEGRNPVYADAARELGRTLAQHGIGLVYGGGSLGLMGAAAKATLGAGGHVTGIIPKFLTERERMLREVQQLIVTDDMHERKRLMFENADAFVSLPGGIGTLEETVEMLTWSQLGQHDKPILLVNVDGFWNPLCALFDHMLDQAFIRPGLMVRYLVAESVAEVVPMLKARLAERPPASDPEVAEKM